MRYPRIHQIQLRQILYRHRPKRAVPAVFALEVRAEAEVPEGARVVVEHGAHFAHVGPAVVVFGAEGEFVEVAEGGDAFGVEVPAAGRMV